MVMLRMCMIIHIAVVSQSINPNCNEKICTKFFNNTNDIKGYQVISPHVEICLWRRDCMAVFRLWHPINKGNNVQQVKNKPVYILFAKIYEVCFVYNRWTTRGLNKPIIRGTKPNGSTLIS